MSMTIGEAREIDTLFHKLWTKAVGIEDYEKGQWIHLENRLHELIRLAGVPAGWGSNEWNPLKKA